VPIHCAVFEDRRAEPHDWRALYPFEDRELRIGGLRYHYVDEGPASPAETLLMVHGNPTWSFHWRNLICRWRALHRCVAPDSLGSGLSDKPSDWSYRLTDHVDNLVRLIDALDLERITLVAQDWGGAIGLGAALERPDRFGRLVLLNCGAFRPWFVPWRIRACRTPIVGRLAVQGLGLFSRAALRMTMVRPERLTPQVRRGYLAPYDSWANRVGVYRFVKDIPLTRRHPTYETLGRIESRLPELAERPVALGWGMRDWCFTPACLEKFIEIFPAAHVHRLADAGHWVVEDATDDVVRLAEDFLAKHPVQPTVV